MQSIIDFFNNLPSVYRSYILIGGLVLFWAVEGVLPLHKISYAKYKHAGINLFFTLTTVLVNFSLAFLLYWASHFTQQNGFGLYNWLPMNIWVNGLIAFLVLDFVGAYLAHLTQHKVKFMWQFHLVHHTDEYVDATTANRHHPGESIIRAIFTGLAILIAGAPFGLVILYQSASALFSQFNHANIKLPNVVDKVIGYIIVSPNIHKVHHHYKQPFSDSNYGNIFSIWDRLLFTYKSYNSVASSLVYGLDTHYKEKENSHILSILKMPFNKYRTPKQ